MRLRSSENTEEAPTRQRELGTGPTALEYPLDVPDVLSLSLARGAAVLARALASWFCFYTARRVGSHQPPPPPNRQAANLSWKRRKGHLIPSGQSEDSLHHANVPFNSEQCKDKHVLVKEKCQRIKNFRNHRVSNLHFAAQIHPEKKLLFSTFSLLY